MVKMRLWDHFIGAYTGWAARRTLKGRQVCLVHLQGPLVNINRLTFDLKKKKKSFLPNFEDQVREKFFGLTAATQSCQVKLVLIHE